MINISIADNLPVVMQGISSYFTNHPDIAVRDTLYHLKEVSPALLSKKINILVIDIQLEGLNSMNALKKIIQDHSTTKILIYTSASEKLFGTASLKAGAMGFLSKEVPMKVLEKALLTIAEGKTQFSASVHDTILTDARVQKGSEIYRKLSSRESEVLNFLVNGKKNNEISNLLNLNERTIGTYKLRLLNKLNVTNVVDLVNKAKTLEII